MKFLDVVKVITDDDYYRENRIKEGMIGTIINAEIRDESFRIIFTKANSINNKDIIFPIKIKDLELVRDMECPDEWILNALPNNNPRWWCKVEDGFIINLKGEKRNIIQYDYDT